MWTLTGKEGVVRSLWLVDECECSSYLQRKMPEACSLLMGIACKANRKVARGTIYHLEHRPFLCYDGFSEVQWFRYQICSSWHKHNSCGTIRFNAKKSVRVIRYAVTYRASAANVFRANCALLC